MLHHPHKIFLVNAFSYRYSRMIFTQQIYQHTLSKRFLPLCTCGGVQLFLGFIIIVGPSALCTSYLYDKLSNCQNWDGKKWRLIPDMLGVHVSVNIIIELIVIVEYTQWLELLVFYPKIMFPSFSFKRLLIWFGSQK